MGKLCRRYGSAQIKKLSIPPGWIFIESGAPGLTRRIKSTGDYWLMVHSRRNRIESIGLLAPSTAINQIMTTLTTERANPAYQKNRLGQTFSRS